MSTGAGRKGEVQEPARICIGALDPVARREVTRCCNGVAGAHEVKVRPIAV